MTDKEQTDKEKDGWVKDADGDLVPPEALNAGPSPRSFQVPGNDVSGFVGVSPEYANYSHPTGKAILTGQEAWESTELTDEQVAATREDREGAMEGEAPAVVDDGYVEAASEQQKKEEEAKAKEEEETQVSNSNEGQPSTTGETSNSAAQNPIVKSETNKADSEKSPKTSAGPVPPKTTK